ncbi:MAG TPA: DMT family transporter [Moraxellaceae bacterium]|nr:DMT family transporter [Moraxellaceae bacterium]
MSAGTLAEPPQQRGITPAYLGLVLIWSTTPLAMVVSLRDFDAVWALALRMALAALLAHVVLRVAGLRLALTGDALRRYAIGALSMYGAMLFTYLGARHLPSGMVAVLFGLSPLVVGLLSFLVFRAVRFSALQWLGLAVAVAGLAQIFLQGGKLASVDVPSVAFVLLGIVSYATSALWLKQLPQALPPLVQTTGALWLSALAALATVPFLAEAAPLHWPSLPGALALVYSAALGSIVAMLCYFFLLQRIEVGTMALTTLVTPVFALLLGMVFNHERFHAGILWGMGLILLGLAAYYERELRRALAPLLRGEAGEVRVPE